MKPRLVVQEKPEDLAAALVARWREIAGEAVAARGLFTAALPGGRTPEGFFLRLAREPGLPWSLTHVFQTDERLVPSGHPESNARLLRAALLDGLPVQPAGVHTVSTASGDPGMAARDYEAELLAFFQVREGGRPAFDLVLLGLGADGHTASLFPGTAALAEGRRLVAAVPAEPPRAARVTLTLPLINAARHAIFLVTGADKRSVLTGLLSRRETGLPAARISPREGALEIYADFAAAGQVRS